MATGKQLPTFRNVIVPSSSNSPRRVSSRVPRTYLTLETNTTLEMSERVTYSLHIATSQKTRILCAMCYCAISIHLPVKTVPTDRGTTIDIQALIIPRKLPVWRKLVERVRLPEVKKHLHMIYILRHVPFFVNTARKVLDFSFIRGLEL